MIRTFEKQACKIFNGLRKTASGKGAVGTEVRVAGEVLFVKFATDYSVLERRLFRAVQSSPDSERAYFDAVKADMTGYVDKKLSEIFPGLKSTNIILNVSLHDDLSFATIILNENIEKKILSGEVSLPSKV